MRRSRLKRAGRLMMILVGLAVLIGVGLWLVDLALDSSRKVVEARYLAIHPGMTRTEVRRLVQGMGTVLFTGVESTEIMHIDGRYMIAVTYQPDPKDPSPTTQPVGIPHDDWIVKQKVIVEIGRGHQVDNALVGLNLRSERFVDRVRMP